MTNDQRRQQLKQFYQDYADPTSLAFKGGDLTSGIAGTAGAGGLIGKGIAAGADAVASSFPALASVGSKFANTLTSGGFSTGAAPATTVGGQVGNAAIRVAGGAGAGAAQAGLINPQDTGTGAVIGGAIPVVGKVLGTVGSAMNSVASPIINPTKTAAGVMSDAAGINPSTMADMLSQYPQYVPGVQPTSAQIVGTPGLVQLEKSMSNNPEFKTQMMDLANSNNKAILNRVNQVAGNPGDMEAYAKIRSDNAQQAYQQAFSEYDPSNVTPWVKGQITQLTKRPAMIQAMQDAQTQALNDGIKLDDSTSIQGLHYAKMSLDDMISSAMRKGDNNSARTLQGTRDQLLGVMDKLSPSYADAMSGYAADSVPVNTMQVGQDIQQNLWNKPPNSALDPQVNYTPYRTAMANALKDAPYGIHPDAQAALDGIQNELWRGQVSNSVKMPGSDTKYNGNAQDWLSKKIYGDDFSGSSLFTKGMGTSIGGAIGSMVGGLPGAGAGAVAGGGAALGLSNFVGGRVRNALADMLADPQSGAEALRQLQLSKSQKTGQYLQQYLNNPALLSAPTVLSTQY